MAPGRVVIRYVADQKVNITNYDTRESGMGGTEGGMGGMDDNGVY